MWLTVSQYILGIQPDGVETGIKSITVDGNAICGNVIPATPGSHTVEVVMG